MVIIRTQAIRYVSALATANRFLQAWQNQDHESGLLMLTDDAKQHSSEILMEAFFSSGADAAYEIARGKKVTAGRYTFPVTLFPLQSAPARRKSRRNRRWSWFRLAKTSGQSINFPSRIVADLGVDTGPVTTGNTAGAKTLRDQS